MLHFIDSSSSKIKEKDNLILRILDPEDNMDNEFIEIDEYKNNIRHYYQKIIDTGYSPEEFFEMVRIKNQRLEDTKPVG
jgi:uncharacterized protein YaaR (DUF327 family)